MSRGASGYFPAESFHKQLAGRSTCRTPWCLGIKNFHDTDKESEPDRTHPTFFLSPFVVDEVSTQFHAKQKRDCHYIYSVPSLPWLREISLDSRAEGKKNSWRMVIACPMSTHLLGRPPSRATQQRRTKNIKKSTSIKLDYAKQKSLAQRLASSSLGNFCSP